MSRLGVFYLWPVHCGPFELKGTSREFFILGLYILALLGENARARGFIFSFGRFWPFSVKMYLLRVFFVSLYILASLGKNVLAGSFLFAAGSFLPLWAKMYRLGVSSSQPIHFGHLGEKCTS